MKALGKRLYIQLDEPVIEEAKTGGIQKDFTPKVIKPTTGIIKYIGDQVTENRFTVGERVFVGKNYSEELTEVPGVGSFTVVTEDSLMAKL